MKNKLKIAIISPKIEFPIREGIRNQAWNLAKHLSKKNDVEIISIGGRNYNYFKEGINIKEVSWLNSARIDADIIHYLIHPTPLIIPSLFTKSKKVMTIYDGGLCDFWKMWWGPILTFLINKKISLFSVQTEYQKNILRKHTKKEIRLIPPIISNFTQKKIKSKKPTILFMSSTHRLKGMKEVIEAFKRIKNKAQLIIAVSDVGNKDVAQKWSQGLNVRVKTIVDPQEELNRAWVYVYPYQKISETFSVPLSFIESIQTKTPFIGPDFETTQQYFETINLVNPKDTKNLAKKIDYFTLNKKIIPKLKVKISNENTFKKLEELYE